MENDLLLGISQVEIESRSANIAKDAVGTDIAVRRERKKDRVQSYVDDEAPWHKSILHKLDLTGMPYNPTNEDIESRLQKVKFEQESQIKREVTKLLDDGNIENLKKNVLDIVSKISGTSRNDLVHYIALRRNILDIFGRVFRWMRPAITLPRALCMTSFSLAKEIRIGHPLKTTTFGSLMSA